MDIPIEIVKLGMEMNKMAGNNKHNPVILAGGAPRDLDNGKEVRDWDFYVPMSAVNKMGLAEYYMANGDEYDFKVCNINLNGHDVQIIAVENTLRDGVDTFDFGICKIYYDFCREELIRHQSYINDIKNKTITYVLNTYPDGRTISHYRRIKDKYPDFLLNKDKYPDFLLKMWT